MCNLKRLASPSMILCAGLFTVGGTLYSEPIVAALIAAESLSDLSGVSSDLRVMFVELSRGDDLTPFDSFPGYYDSAGWSIDGSFPGLASSSYVSLGFTIAEGFALEVNTLSFYYEDGGDGNGPARVELRSSLDGFASSLHTDTNTFSNTVETYSAGVPADIYTGDVEFRFYGYGAGTINGILGFTNNVDLDFEGSSASILLEGDLMPVPEMGTLALWISASCFLWSVVRRRRTL